MEPLPHEPRNFKEIVEADLRRAARLVIKVQDEIDPQFRFATPRGDYWIAVTLPGDDYERTAMLRRLSTFMVWRQALGFTMAVETYEPDAVYCVGVGQDERHNCLARINRHPRPWTARNFGPVEWLPPASIDPAVIAMLPTAPRPVTPKEISALDKWFGASGKFPAVHIESGQIRGLA